MHQKKLLKNKLNLKQIPKSEIRTNFLNKIKKQKNERGN